MDRLKVYATQHYLQACFVGGALLGTICFILIYGICPLDVGNEAYIINEGTDLPGFQIVWDAYRYAGWKDGIGLFDTLTYPNTTSYVVADQVSLLGLFLKVLAPILPKTFQYVGLWGLMCFFLQGGFAAIIIRKFCNNNVISIIYALPFILASPVSTKLFYHHAQAGQWVLLMVFALWLYNVEKNHFSIKEYVVWALVGLVTTGVNIYFIPMVGMIFVGYSINCIMNNKKYIISSLVSLCSYLGACIFYIWIMGGFASNFNSDDTFYSEYIDRLYRCGANLNTFFNSSGIAYFGRALNVAKDGQGEGHAYLGAGMIIALVVAVSYKIATIVGKRKQIGMMLEESVHDGSVQSEDNHKQERNLSISLLIVFSLSVIVGIGPTLSIGSKILWYIPYPSFILKLWCNFRSTGRMIWVAYYIVYISIFRMIIQCSYTKEKVYRYFAITLLGICCVIQVVDLHPYLEGKHKYFAHYQELDTSIHDEAWSILGTNYEHMVVLPNSLLNRSDERNDLAKLAIDYDLTLNDYYLARQNLLDQTPAYQEKFSNNEFDEDTFYVIPYSYLPFFIDYNLYYYKLDNYVVGTLKNISTLINKKSIDKEFCEMLAGSNNNFLYDNIDYTAVFDPVYYYYTYSDLWNSDITNANTLFEHFITVGMIEGRQANENFSPIAYKEKNSDIKAALGEGDYPAYYRHYLVYGINENRICN